MANIEWGPPHREQTDTARGDEIPGDTNAPDIVGRTGEEMPEVAHDGDDPDDETDESV